MIIGQGSTTETLSADSVRELLAHCKTVERRLFPQSPSAGAHLTVTRAYQKRHVH